MVKNFVRSGRMDGKVEQDFFGRKLTPWRAVNNKVIVPDEEEQRTNPRSRWPSYALPKNCNFMTRQQQAKSVAVSYIPGSCHLPHSAGTRFNFARGVLRWFCSLTLAELSCP